MLIIGTVCAITAGEIIAYIMNKKAKRLEGPRLD